MATDPETKRIHDVEQLTGYLREQAQQASAYFTELRRQGFDRREAMELTIVMQRERFRSLYSLPAAKPEG